MSSLEHKYIEIAELTFEHCKKTCSRIGSCCEQTYCELAIQYAAEEYGLALEPTSHPKLPLLGDDGQCIAPPHVRPLCSMHSCDISNIGIFKNDPERTEKYFKLRNEIDHMECDRMFMKN